MTRTSEQQHLAAILSSAVTDDTHEEDVLDFLHDHAIPYATHNRQALITLAFHHGWRPA
jgi:hypothetical protein